MRHFEWKSTDGCTIAGFHEEPACKAKAVACLVHGLGEHSGRYQDVAGVLSGAGIALYSLDLRGHGLSYGRRGHAAPRSKILADVDMLIRQARNAHPGLPLWLYGHSLGGNIVLSHRLFGKEPVSGTVATSPSARRGGPCLLRQGKPPVRRKSGVSLHFARMARHAS